MMWGIMQENSPLTFCVINLLDWSMSCDLLVGVVYWEDQDSV